MVVCKITIYEDMGVYEARTVQLSGRLASGVGGTVAEALIDWANNLEIPNV